MMGAVTSCCAGCCAGGYRISGTPIMSTGSILRSGPAASLLAGLILVGAPVPVLAEEGAKGAGEGAEAAGEGKEASGERAEGVKKEKAEVPVTPDYFPMQVLNIPVLKKTGYREI